MAANETSNKANLFMRSRAHFSFCRVTELAGSGWESRGPEIASMTVEKEGPRTRSSRLALCSSTDGDATQTSIKSSMVVVKRKTQKETQIKPVKS